MFSGFLRTRDLRPTAAGPIYGVNFALEATGDELHKWASQIEESVFDVLDDLGGDGKPLPRAASGLDALH